MLLFFIFWKETKFVFKFRFVLNDVVWTVPEIVLHYICHRWSLYSYNWNYMEHGHVIFYIHMNLWQVRAILIVLVKQTHVDRSFITINVECLWIMSFSYIAKFPYILAKIKCLYCGWLRKCYRSLALNAPRYRHTFYSLFSRT